MLITTITPALFASITVVLVGCLILWSNPRRVVNRVVFTCSLHLAIWLGCLHLSRTAIDGLLWVRLACIVGASVPIHFWLVLHESMATHHLAPVGRFFRSNFLWIVITVFLTYLPTTQFFIRTDSPAGRGAPAGYALYIAAVGAMYFFLAIGAYTGSRKLPEGKRLELQVWLFGGCAMTMLILILMILNRITGNRDLIHIYQPAVVMLFYAGIGVAITTGRLFDARQLFLMVMQKVVLVLAVAGFASLIDNGISAIFDNGVDSGRWLHWAAWIATSALTLGLAYLLNTGLNRWLKVYPEDAEARKAAFEAAKAELTVDGLEQAFLPVLRGWGKADHAVVLSGPKDDIKGCGLKLPANAPMVDVLRRIRWATPERLARERSDEERAQISDFMARQNLGVLVCSRGLSLTVLVGVGLPISRRPFTYPQVVQLMELTEIVESALERAHFSTRAQQAERLATVGLLGAGVAHEIRNPLVTIKTFVQLLPQRHQEEGFRRKFFQLISEEITRIDRLTERLMELGSPRSYFMVPQPLHPLVRGTLELVEPKAADRGVEIATDFQAVPDVIDTDAAAARQVLLNLCLNAVHAMESTTGPRRIRLATRNVAGGVEVCITDSGPGLASEMLPRLFTPFQSTKSTGFGLGLAISSEIMSGLKGTIAADPPRAGAGATFRLIFPCPSPSS